MKLPPTSKEFVAVLLLGAFLSLNLLSDAWTVFAVGGLEKISCSGPAQRLFCTAGSMLGHLFEPNSPWLGYVLFKCFFGLFIFFVAWLAYLRRK